MRRLVRLPGRTEVPRLAELRLEALVARIDADLCLARHGAVTGELRRLVAEHPFRERFWEQLMLALYRDGRQGEALAAYQQARKTLSSEVGVDPGPRLKELHNQILTSDPALGITAAATTRPGPEPVVPRQLPSSMAHFIGRAGELAALDGLIDDAGRTARGAVVISAVAGTAGVGKTALTVRWAHQAAERFRDGQLYVNLRGFEPVGAPGHAGRGDPRVP